MWRQNEQMYEYACHEANYGMFNILRGARYQERQQAVVKPHCIRPAMHRGRTALLVAHISSNMLAPRALPATRLTGLGATRGFTTACQATGLE